MSIRSRAAAAPALALLACGSTGPKVDGELPPGEVAFEAIGSLSAPEGRGAFRFGVATAATQIEDQNENTDWWLFTAPDELGGLGRGENFVGDASLGFTRAIDDVELIAAMNLDSYRFSVEWARVEPSRGVIDEAALAHYDELIDALLARGIRPMITVHHFSNPVWVADPRDRRCDDGPSDQNLCGLLHPEGGPLVVEAMADHARLLAARFGDRVDEWVTLNEPMNYLLAAYGVGEFPPGHTTAFGPIEEFVPALRNYIAAHAAMYHAIKEADTIDATGDGVAASVGFSLNVVDWVPARDNEPSDHPDDLAARDRVTYVYHHLFVDSVLAGSFDSNLDGVADEEHPEWAGTLDWLGVQYYSRQGVTGSSSFLLGLTPCFPPLDGGACVAPADPTFCVPKMGYEHHPGGIHAVLADFGARWPELPMVVTEGGIATEAGARRAENLVRALEQVERARRDGVDVRGYYHWSLIDNFEWAEGYGPRFGLYRVDYATFERTSTLGAEVYARIAADRRMSADVRALHGGLGPMTPEPGHEDDTWCAKL